MRLKLSSQSIQFSCEKYDMVLEMLQASQKQIAELEVNMKEQVNFKILITKKDCAINVMQQYLRRDCIENTGIPTLPLDNPKQLVIELGSLIDVIIGGDQISTAHRLPDFRKVKNRIIVKFVQR